METIKKPFVFMAKMRYRGVLWGHVGALLVSWGSSEDNLGPNGAPNGAQEEP